MGLNLFIPNLEGTDRCSSSLAGTQKAGCGTVHFNSKLGQVQTLVLVGWLAATRATRFYPGYRASAATRWRPPRRREWTPIGPPSRGHGEAGEVRHHLYAGGLEG